MTDREPPSCGWNHPPGPEGVVVFHPCCHGYLLGSKRLASVTKVMREVLPDDYTGVDVDVVESARERGCEVDALITAYVRGEMTTHYPANTREDSIDLFERLFLPFWQRSNFGKVGAQIITHDNEIAGMIDLLADEYSTVIDVKATFNVLSKHHIQVAAYAELSGARKMMLIHLSKRFSQARIVDVPQSARHDWKVVREFWALKKRLK